MHKAIVIPPSSTKDPIHFLSLFTGTLSTEKPLSKKSFKRRNLSDPDLEQMGFERVSCKIILCFNFLYIRKLGEIFLF